ncbi:phytoene synthase [Rhizobium sp. RU35A]|uniref:phytoene/squalene synthase family protein n=1 Tax=Rhizobium sp. RU35A TaxID=1907414 RepID=UPI000953DA42|nr:phytoene/squalene synthase family protein [Rhizobium sp. RU35A]SIQ81317.1 phytoene synthase [Rhizobium sp. RU35A]
MTAAAGDHWDICLSTLRETDRDRYLACLLSPEDKRGALAALYAFNAEIARIRDVVQQPLAGEIRLQWWRDLLSGQASGDTGGNPLAVALMETVERHRLPRQSLTDMIEARIFDLYDDPMPDRNALEGYAGEIASALIQLAGLVLDAPAAMQQAETAGHAGVAQAVAGLLLLMPQHRRRGQVYVPQDILSATGLDRDGFLDDARKENVAHAVGALAALGLEHLGKAARSGMPSVLVPAFLPVAIAAPVLKQAARRPQDALDGKLQSPQWRRQLSMLKMMALKRF